MVARLFDTHCHLYDQEAFPDPALAVARAADAGVDRMVVIGIDFETNLQAVALADRFERVYATVGWHPTHVGTYESSASLAQLRELASHPKVVGIGEIGLDFYWDKTTPMQQIPALHEQLDLAIELGLPAVYHCRDAYDEMLDLLEARACPKAVFHCFGGNAEHAQRALALGCFLGVDGPLTYKKNAELRDLFGSLPRDRVLIETDAPYLSPEPLRSKRNEPANVALVCAKLAEVWGVPSEEAARQTTANAVAFFGLEDD